MIEVKGKYFLYCSEHNGLVPNKSIDTTEGEITGFDFPECKEHPSAAIFKVYSLEQIMEKYSFIMFEDRKHLK